MNDGASPQRLNKIISNFQRHIVFYFLFYPFLGNDTTSTPPVDFSLKKKKKPLVFSVIKVVFSLGKGFFESSNWSNFISASVKVTVNCARIKKTVYKIRI